MSELRGITEVVADLDAALRGVDRLGVAPLIGEEIRQDAESPPAFGESSRVPSSRALARNRQPYADSEWICQYGQIATARRTWSAGDCSLPSSAMCRRANSASRHSIASGC